MSTTLNEIPKVFLHGETLESAELNEIISLVNLTIRKINNVETNLENHSYDVSIPITSIYCRTKKGVNAINFFPQADAKRDELLDLVSNCSTTQGIKYNTTFSTVTLSDNADLMNGIWTAYPQGVSESLPHEWEVSYKKLEDNSIMYMYGPVLRSNYGYSGADGDSVQYVYKTFSHLLTDIERTNNTPIRPENPDANGEFIPSGWFDDPQGPTAEYPFEYVATLKRINGIWGSFEKIALWSTYTEDGANGDFLIRAFCRFTPTSNKLTPNTPIGGVYNSPLPGSNDNIQWSLNVPSGTEPVWTSTKIFRGSGQDTEWSTPTIEADSTTLDIEYSSNTEKPAENTLRDTPGNNHPSTGIWHDPTEVNIDLSTMIWRAERKIKNGQYDGNWVITKIAGSKGAFKSIVFRRFKPTQQLSSPATPTGGTYSNPIPDGGLWYDGIPAGDSKTDGPIWSSTKIFHDDGTLTNWSAPQLQSDSEDLDIEFSPGIGEEHTQPSNPTGEPFSNREASGWYDPSSANFNTAGDMIWRAERKVKNGLYVGAWTVTKIVGEQGPEGKKGSFKSCVFKRSNNTLTGFNASDDGGATYDNPIPTGWTDGIPAGTETLWMAVSLFTGEGDNHSNWTVTQQTDSVDLDIEFSPEVGPTMDLSAGSVFTHPINNYESNGITPTADRTTRNNLGWWDSSQLDENSPTMVWRAERKIHNQNYEGNWVITRINGENGEDGKNAVLVSLDNEHEDFLYNDAGTLIAPSGGTTSQARLYDGNIDKTLNTTWRISDDGGVNWGTTTNTNANASINTSTGLLTITGINANSVKIKVRGEYNSKYYYIEFTANKTNLDKYDLLINPNAIAYNSATYQAQNITINVKCTDLQGNATNLNWGAYNNRDKISTTADKGYLRAFIFLYQPVAQDTYDIVPVRRLSSTFLATAASMEHLDNFRIELRKYSDPNSSDANDFTIVDYENIEIAKVTNGIDGANGLDGESAPFYTKEWYAWSNQESTASATTEPTPNSGWSSSISNQSSYAYLWKKIITYTWNAGTRTYSEGTAQYFRMSGTNGTSINVKGKIEYAYNTVADFPAPSTAGGRAIAKSSNAIYVRTYYSQQFHWTHVSDASDGDSYVIYHGNFDGNPQSEDVLANHLVQWSSEANEWIDLGQFKGESGVTYYTHVVWAQDVTIVNGSITSITGYTPVKPSGDSTYIWMGVHVDTNVDDPVQWNDTVTWEWTNTKGEKGSTGARGKIGRFFYFAGTFDRTSNTPLPVNDAQAPYFEHTEENQKRYHVYNPEVNPPLGVISMADMWDNTGSWNVAPWEAMTNDFKYIITQALFSDYAQLGKFIISGDWMLSTNGTINGVSYNNGATYNDSAAYTWFDPAYPSTSVNTTHTVNGTTWSGYNFVPNYCVDGLTGETYQQNAHIKGEVIATRGSFTGTVNAQSGTFRGTIHAGGGSITGNVDITGNGKLSVGTYHKIEISPDGSTWGAKIVGKDSDTEYLSLGFAYSNGNYTPELILGLRSANNTKISDEKIELRIVVSSTEGYNITQGHFGSGTTACGVKIFNQGNYSFRMGVEQNGNAFVDASSWPSSDYAGWSDIPVGRVYSLGLDDLAHIIDDPQWDRRNNWAALVIRRR